MAHQKSLTPYAGKLGETTGYPKGKRYFVKKNTASYQPPEESMKSASEFGRISKAAALCKKAITPLLPPAFDYRLYQKLVQAFGIILRSGPEAQKGSRTVYDGNLKLLKNFPLNTYNSLSGLIRMNPEITLKEKIIKVQLPEIDLSKALSPPAKAEQVNMLLGFAALNFHEDTFQFQAADPLVYPVKGFSKAARLNVSPPQEGEWLYLVLMTLYFSDKGPIVSRRYMAGSILEAFHLKDGEEVLFQEQEKALPAPNAPDPTGLSWEFT